MEMDTGRQPKRRLFGSVRQSLRAQIGLIVLLSYLIPVVLLGVFTGGFLMKKLENQTRAAITSGAEQAWTLTEQKIQRTLDLARDATYDGELMDSWQKWKDGSVGDNEYMRLGRSYLERKYSREPLLSFVACFPVEKPDMRMYLRNGAMENTGELQALCETVLAMGEELDTRCRFIRFGDNIYLVRNLLNLRMERFGMLILGINEESVFRPLTELGQEWDAQVAVRLDDCGDPETEWVDLGSGLTDDRKEKLYYTRLSGDIENGLNVQLTMDRRKQYSEVYSFQMLLLVMALLLLPIMILIGVYLSRRIVKPLTLLSAASRRIEEGKLGATVPLNGEDELGRLGRSFSQMSLRLKELIDKTYKEEIELKNAQILALQSRINPHFINNALEDINWTARMEGSENISSMVTSLSVLLNATMAREDRRLVTLREEMEVAEAYIYFIEQRFGTDLTVNREIEEKAMDGILPLLTIQPLLENAVEHGIAPAGGGVITIRCSLNDACMHVEIINTGRETGKEDRERIEAALHGQPTGKHLGLANIVNRLRLIYGESVTIRVDTDTPGQTTVSIVIPREIH
ncbi:sensor histidine kinase [Aristaeella lactis]|uniref:Histidine kinase-, DNA gyrase B-, and HSP90-like ATPase n=1 Tax=Aristaeella lactis TaxID=3046383 RepID=A0AC61PJU4_9FIRM|nr:histidine kinase [Aristaeella lactis]QUA51744.1 histidine kinase [Aristaeella lactis]SMC50425.1 Histidine kinase-, DNA gyrase B-, and HSP90-like ATPase [Aristaeella lactis]